MSILPRLSGAAYGMHFADQIALVCVPLVAALVFDASAQVIGVLVACQSLAHLLGSIPFGILVDQHQLRTLAIASALISLIGFASAAIYVLSGLLFGFGVAITLAGFGTVLFALSALSILPRSVGTDGLAKANAAIELPRALCAFGVPLMVGFVIGVVPAWLIFAAACLGAALALRLTFALPRFEIATRAPTPIFAGIVKGGHYVARHPLLRAISLCAIFWNLAFATLLVVMVPVLQDLYRFDPSAFGFALSAFGLAGVLGSWLSRRFANRIVPAVILLFGPGSSVVAVAGLLTITPQSTALWLYACFFLLGLGPSMWLIAQNSVRQLVTPAPLLGRVNAVIQTAIYGIRPLGALLGGFVVGVLGPEAGLICVVIAFALSFAAALFSGLRSVMSYERLSPDRA